MEILRGRCSPAPSIGANQARSFERAVLTYLYADGVHCAVEHDVHFVHDVIHDVKVVILFAVSAQAPPDVATVLASAQVDPGEEDDMMRQEDRNRIWNYFEHAPSLAVDPEYEVHELVRLQGPDTEVARDLFLVPFGNVRPDILAGRSGLE